MERHNAVETIATTRMTEGKHYFSYLLRVWLAEEGSQPQWRASLEDTHSGERQGFASLEDMGWCLKELTRLNSREKEADRK
jgi:hypothetical protein